MLEEKIKTPIGIEARFSIFPYLESTQEFLERSKEEGVIYYTINFVLEGDGEIDREELIASIKETIFDNREEYTESYLFEYSLPPNLIIYYYSTHSIH